MVDRGFGECGTTALARSSLALALLLPLAACDGSAGRPRVPAADAPTTIFDASPPVADAASPPAEAAPPPSPVTEELPRLPADPKLTHRLVPVAAGLVGGDASSCTHEPGATGDRWCAFHRKSAAGQAELWVFNVTAAIAGAPLGCGFDGSATAAPSPHCLRLTDDLWTGTTLWGPSHPTAHRFEDDTLVFHTGPGQATAPLHQGVVWAWRPGWPTPQPVTSDKGILCFSQPRTRALVCVDNATIDQDPGSPFDRPRLQTFDVLAGTLGAPPFTPLPRLVRLANNGAEAAARLRLTPDGSALVFSRVPAAGQPEVVEIQKLGGGTATPVLTGAADWEIGHDGQKLYYLANFDRQRGEQATGTLMRADFPGGASPTMLAKDVYGFRLLGAHDDTLPTGDRGLALRTGVTGQVPTFSIMRDASKPTALTSLTLGAEFGEVASDLAHTLYYRLPRGAAFPVAYVHHNDGSGVCQLTADLRAETYGGHFTESGRSVFWIEYGRRGSESEEGWYAQPASCGERIKFGDFVFGFRLVGEQFVVFEGGDLADSTSWLQYTALKTPTAPAGGPRVVKERPDPIVDLVRAGADKQDVYVLFTTAAGGPSEVGLYLHGPLR